ncbi:MAG: hypothetical protein LBK66_04900, partial [Spirochaetaceae bacterium]|nr:hypothetical protein [Spirochaetaceae bacterium]
PTSWALPFFPAVRAIFFCASLGLNRHPPPPPKKKKTPAAVATLYAAIAALWLAKAWLRYDVTNTVKVWRVIED